MVEMLAKFNAEKTLIVVREADDVIYKSARNIEGAELFQLIH